MIKQLELLWFRTLLMSAVPTAAGLGPIACGQSNTTNSPYGAWGSTSQPNGIASGTATFGDVYTQVIETSCAPCHTTTGASGIGISLGKLDLTSQAAAFTNLVGVQTSGSECKGAGILVTPGNPDASIFYLKLRRFHGALNAARQDNHANWASIAAAAGYYDQAHLVAEFRAIAGVTPRALLSELRGTGSSATLI